MTQALFANQRETNLQSMVALIDEVLGELGHDPAASRATEPKALHAWQIKKGSALTRVTLIERTEFTHLRVCSIVMTVPSWSVPAIAAKSPSICSPIACPGGVNSST